MSLPNSNDPRQLGLGALLGLPQTAAAGRPLMESVLDSLKRQCIGMGSKVTEEIAALKLAAELAAGERETTLLASIQPEDLDTLLKDRGLAALDAGVSLAIVYAVHPHLTQPSWADNVATILQWRKARLQVRLLVRFEYDNGTAGLAALKAWEETQRDAPTAGHATGELELRDAIIDDPELLQRNLIHMNARRGAAGGDGGNG